ncbi:MAG: hypothetical protein LBH60_04905 [Prevotellaceae bacterium]|jgi:hypothetical protein|nr:hypothetical protein [Prevotellaceae bacterium]
MKKTVETKVAETILQKNKEIVIGNETYQVATPSTATLILASEAISRLPYINLDSENIASESLYIAKDCRILGNIIAILILGAKNLQGIRKITKRRFLGILKEETEEIIDNEAILSKKILEEVSPKQLNELLTELLQSMEVAFFFATSTSLIEINLLRKTREVGTTAFGQ